MRIVFMGTPEFAVPSLRILHEHEYEIVSVVTAPDRPRGRGQQVSFTPVKEFALKDQLSLLQPENLKDSKFISTIASMNPDTIVVVAFRILPKEVFAIPKRGSFNLHASLLPKYRGPAPIHWAIINGETQSGVTTFFLNEKVDTGSVILQARVKIGPEETAGELHDRLAEVGAEVVLQTVRLIELGKAQPRSQDDSLASAAPKIFKEDCRIDWSKTREQAHNFVRGLSPNPCAWTMHGDNLLKIYRTSLSGVSVVIGETTRAGDVVYVDKSSLVAQAGNGFVKVLELQLEGKKRMSAEEFLRGYKIRVGDQFV